MNNAPISIVSTEASPQARGLRVRHIRETLLRYSREKFGRKYGIPATSIQNWEIGKYGGLTEKAANKLVNAFTAEGIPCSVEWLLYGIGLGPVKMANGAASETLENALNPDSNIKQELQFFHRINPGAVDAIMADDSMFPAFLKGDLVAGIRYFEESIDGLVGESCIIQLTTGEIVVRAIKSKVVSGNYILDCYNTAYSLWVGEQSIFSAAPIMWVRRFVHV